MKNRKENIRKGIYKYSNTYKYLNTSIYKITYITEHMCTYTYETSLLIPHTKKYVGCVCI